MTSTSIGRLLPFWVSLLVLGLLFPVLIVGALLLSLELGDSATSCDGADVGDLRENFVDGDEDSMTSRASEGSGEVTTGAMVGIFVFLIVGASVATTGDGAIVGFNLST